MRTIRLRWMWRTLFALLLGAVLLARGGGKRRSAEPAPAGPPLVEAALDGCEETEDPALAELANEILDSGRTHDPASADLDRFERERDPAVLAPLAAELASRLEGEEENRMIADARGGDEVHREYALLALTGHVAGAEAMLGLADLAQPPNVADRALDALLSISDRLEGAQRDEARARARLLAERGETAPRATALLLLAELGTDRADRRLLESLARHADPRVSLAAKRALVEHLGACGESDSARLVWDTISREFPSLLEKEP